VLIKDAPGRVRSGEVKFREKSTTRTRAKASCELTPRVLPPLAHCGLGDPTCVLFHGTTSLMVSLCLCLGRVHSAWY